MADVSLDSSFDITAEVIESTPIEKCSLNPRRGRNSRRLLTGFIIYASEVRKEVVEQYPDQNFGFISKLVGDKWRALSTDLRFKYHQRALIHNKRIKELAAREGVPLGDVDLATGSVIKAPKITKKKLAKLSKRDKSLNDSSASTTPNLDKSSLSPDTSTSNTSFSTPAIANAHSKSFGGDFLDGHSNHKHFDASTPKNYSNNHVRYSDHQYLQHQVLHPHQTRQSKKVNTVDSATQTPSIRFVEPPPKKPLSHSHAFIKRLHELYQQKQLLEQQQQLQQLQQQQQLQQLQQQQQQPPQQQQQHPWPQNV